MRVKYFADTDLTGILNKFSVETQAVNENMTDLDSRDVVSLTIEHAGQAANMEEFLYQRILLICLLRQAQSRPRRQSLARCSHRVQGPNQ
jgi:uncharacterized protein YuzE